MSPYKKSLITPFKLVVIAFIVLLLANCSALEPIETPTVEQSNTLAIQAQEALSQQQFSRSAMLFKQLAKNS